MTLGVLAFVVALLLSVMLHEAGHFGFAKAFGMKATQFFLGFGPTLWSFRRGETEYGVKAIPAGGFVKIVGMTSLEDVDPGDDKRAFYRQPAPQRAVVLAAGSVVHFIIAFLLLLILYAGIGTPVASTTLASVSPCVPATVDARCHPGDAASPAAATGLRTGDRVLAFDGHKISSWDDFSRAIRAHDASGATLEIERDGSRLTVRPVVAQARRPSLDDPTRTTTVGVLGVSPTMIRQRLGPVAAIDRSATLFRQSITGTFAALGKVPGSIPKLFSADRGVNSPTSVVGIGRISGEVATAKTDVADRVSLFLLIIASLNIFVGIFNLLPLLPLDGGHLAVLGFEQARYGICRVLGRSDPGRVDLTKLLPAAYLVIALFVSLSVLLIAADIVNPINFPVG